MVSTGIYLPRALYYNMVTKLFVVSVTLLFAGADATLDNFLTAFHLAA